jgi:hypothetical protein
MPRADYHLTVAGARRSVKAERGHRWLLINRYSSVMTKESRTGG